LKNIKEIADKLINRFHINDPFELAENLGINVWYRDLKGLKGFYKYHQKNRYIILNENLDEVERKIVCAHELGHAIVHRSKNIVGFNENTLLMNVGKDEYEANVFACEILISDKEVLDLLSHDLDVSQMARCLYTDVNLLLIKLKSMENRGFDVIMPLQYDSQFLKS